MKNIIIIASLLLGCRLWHNQGGKKERRKSNNFGITYSLPRPR